MGKGDGVGAGAGKGRGQGQGEGSGAYKGKQDRIAVPAMPMPMAVVCCILNFLVPGFGTIVAGFSNFCCSRNEDIDNAARGVSCLINWGIGCLQLITAFFCLIGFCWSWAWGIFFIGMSAEYYHNNKVDDGDRGQVITHQPSTVVVMSGYSHQPGTNAVMINQPPGVRFGAPVVATGSTSAVFQTGSKPAPPPYNGPPSEEALYPSHSGGAFPAASDPAYPPGENKVPL